MLQARDCPHRGTQIILHTKKRVDEDEIIKYRFLVNFKSIIMSAYCMKTTRIYI
jgi:hypothetical protein